VRAEILQYRAGLRWYQRQFDDAIDLQERAISLFRLVGDAHPLAESLILRSLIQRYAGQYEAGLMGLHEALQLIDERSNPFLLLSAYYNLAHSYARAHHFKEAADLLPKASALCDQLNSQRTLCHLRCLEGLVLEGQNRFAEAEEKFVESRDGFMKAGEVGFAALASLDLALLCARQGRPSKVASLALEAISAFESLNIHREALAAMKLLRETLERHQISTNALQGIRNLTEELRRDPTAPFSWFGNRQI